MAEQHELDFAMQIAPLGETIQGVFDASSESPEVKLEALKAAVAIALPIAKQQSEIAAGGQWLEIFKMLIELLLPLLLKLLGGGKSVI